MQRDLVYTLDMLQAARRIQTFTNGLMHDALNDHMLQGAVLWQIVLMGEAARRISQEFRASHPEIAWQGIVGMRSRLVHDYDKIDLAEVWNVIQSDIPTLIGHLTPLIPPDEPTS